MWIRRNWNKLENHFKTYAATEQQALSERFHGGSDGQGDIYNAKKYEKRAKDQLLAGFDKVEEQEQANLGINLNVQSDVSSSQNLKDENELEH